MEHECLNPDTEPNRNQTVVSRSEHHALLTKQEERKCELRTACLKWQDNRSVGVLSSNKNKPSHNNVYILSVQRSFRNYVLKIIWMLAKHLNIFLVYTLKNKKILWTTHIHKRKIVRAKLISFSQCVLHINTLRSNERLNCFFYLLLLFLWRVLFALDKLNKTGLNCKPWFSITYIGV